MNGYEKMIKVMREQGKSSPSMKIGTMLSGSSCLLGTLTLDEDDLMVSSHLKNKLEKDDDVLLQKISDETYVIVAKVVTM
jgi:hypothetical protein